VAVVEQPPKGGGDVTIHRDCSHMCIYLALLCICDACALYVVNRRASMAREQVAIYGNCHVLFVRYALCGQTTDTVRVVL
jgi:hypothetical protein